MALSQAAGNSTNASFKDKEKPMAVRAANILAARALSDAVRTSLGPRGSKSITFSLEYIY
ncbi:T-complex protein 1 subunit delta [Cadophora gregata]|uniref:T-complex protein 1 subunit delta n=1 Tax=Cadophora gregata TaxID=51156 RepID=UPI0026DBAFD1|nr:T-complex protein 1 subunit delta [Cadophora gregata]KAK0103297.1 T-complex protein 1 subunit delta [Cadophora gregata]